MATGCISADFIYKFAVARLHCHTAVSSIVVTSLDHSIIQDERDRQLHWLTQHGKHREMSNKKFKQKQCDNYSHTLSIENRGLDSGVVV